jgi:hypothetical protein
MHRTCLVPSRSSGKKESYFVGVVHVILLECRDSHVMEKIAVFLA